MTLLFNIANRSRVLAVPPGMDSGIPVRSQIVGRPNEEQIVFDVGATLQHLRPWPRPGGGEGARLEHRPEG